MSTPAQVLPMENARENAQESEIQRVFRHQRAFAPSLRNTTAAERIAKIRKLRDLVQAHAQQLYLAAAADYGKPQAEVDLAEIMPIVAEANHTIANLKKWMKPRRVPTIRSMLGTSSWIKSEPRGVCLIIAPWNYPVNLAFVPLISAIAAGNTAIIKPSEMAPHLSAVIAKIVRDNFDAREVAVFEGDAAVATELLALPFDHIFFTGSPQLGKVIMAAAARHLSSVTLELGGKSPTIIDASADLKMAARSVLWAKFTNAGQTCIAPDYVYVHNDVKDAFLAECKAGIEEVYGADAQQQMRSPDYCRIVNARHYARVSGLLEDALKRGAQAVVGGTTRAEDRFIAPTILGNVPREAGVMQEEIFGPLLPVLGYSDLDQAIADINRGEKPLALYVYARDNKVVEQVLDNTTAGGTCINGAVVHFLQHHLPFGGVNNSGIGAYHGVHGFRAFSHERAVVRVHYASIRMFYPPYTDQVKRMIKLAMKWFI
jgi:aldehyde dehydrogenase (NAD+)